LYKAVLTPIHENIFCYAAPYISGEDANVEEAMDDWTQIVNALATGDPDWAVFCTRDHIKRYTRRMKQGIPHCCIKTCENYFYYLII
jgi:DNA-binding FadR family transcriptional regulator